MDTQLEKLFQDIRDEETNFEVENSDGEYEGETEVSKYMSKREEQKDRMVGEYDDERILCTIGIILEKTSLYCWTI